MMRVSEAILNVGTSKTAAEAVARFWGRAIGLPSFIAPTDNAAISEYMTESAEVVNGMSRVDIIAHLPHFIPALRDAIIAEQAANGAEANDIMVTYHASELLGRVALEVGMPPEVIDLYLFPYHTATSIRETAGHTPYVIAHGGDSDWVQIWPPEGNEWAIYSGASVDTASDS